ncbi:hypothetical protein PV382_18105 [Streptomyces scabiei]|uniref:hypothetical protein n=1 Tax=Streptomyces scabiei TaxID=1930 RepID=UPI0029A48D2A|nr:hypothetical protein [Streptomyces scabiei]MDX3174191.1 hypothetical protein [Streptomyces scabiei]
MKHRTEQLVDVQHSTTPSTQPAVLERFSAGGPRGSWPAEEFAADRRAEGLNVTVTMDLATDSFLVKQVP